MTAAEQIATANLFADLEDDREGASQYLSIFIDEAQSTLDELIEALLALETGGGKRRSNQLFIAAHRMKGSAASIGLHRIAKLSHLMEDLLQTLRDKGLHSDAANHRRAVVMHRRVAAERQRPAKRRVDERPIS